MITFESLQKFEAIQVMAVFLSNAHYDIVLNGESFENVSSNTILNMICEDMEGDLFILDNEVRNGYRTLIGHDELDNHTVRSKLEMKMILVW